MSRKYIPERYSRENFFRAIRNPGLFLDEIRRFPVVLSNAKFNYKHGKGIDIMEQDWDNLIILDACRYDYFREMNTLSGELTPVVSRGGHSWEFMQGNFVGRELHDTVYITANAHTEKLSDDIFYTVDPLYKNRWTEDPGTVVPSDVVEATLEARDNYPCKRLLTHFMQPHEPPFGPTANEVRERLNVRGSTRYGHVSGVEHEYEGKKWYQSARDGLISQEEVVSAYEETLEFVIGKVEKLIDRLDGKTVITADHGELLGEKLFPLSTPRYGHPHGLATRELRVVPWFVIDSDNRREIFAEEPIGFERLSDSIVNDRLQALGYAPE